MAKHLCGKLHLTASERTTNCCRADWLVDAVGARHELARLNIEIMNRAKLSEQRHVARPVPTEMEIGADHNGACGQAFHQHALDEIGGALERLLFVETHQHRGVDAGGLKQLEFLVEIGEQLRGRLGPHNARRVTIESNNH
ncbi:unannotated protein [freshwater metagenome]|uniref:Unannotated protein n=1 Tax=freshwater metagenome TaxID=449393 RepID=A0A6J6XFC2_9ZZZZ